MTAPARLGSIDACRGLAMVVMVIDHARHAFTWLGNPEDLSTTTPALFVTRWVTHFCAPVFVLLAGVSAHLYAGHGRGRGELARFLLLRGAILIALEATVITFGWLHDLRVILWQVIAAIGVSMIALAGLVWLPRALVLAAGVGLVAGQDLYAGCGAGLQGVALDLWRVAYGGFFDPHPGVVAIGDRVLLPVYPVLPWIGVMAIGYGIGPWFDREPTRRRRSLCWTGAALSLGFLAVRWLDGFGNSRSFGAALEQGPAWMALLACEKYPPSLAFLLMTLGPALVVLALLDRPAGGLARVLVVFGRVPLFFYVLHVYLLHVAAPLVFWCTHGEPVHTLRGELAFLPQVGFPQIRFEPIPDGFRGLPLPMVYVVTVACVALLYAPCRWLGRIRRHGRSRWSSLF